jgi:hypothetical protein
MSCARTRVFLGGVVFISLLVPVHAGGAEDLSVTAARPAMANAHTLRLSLTISGLRPGAEVPSVSVLARVGQQRIEAAVAFRMPSRFNVDLDLDAGRVRIGGVAVAAFTPLPRLEENTRFPVQITVRQGAAEATVQQRATLLIPTVIVPGYLNDLGKTPTDVLEVFEQRGYEDEGPSPTLYWFAYPSRTLALEDASRALATYVRRVVLSSTYAARINVIGHSLGGLLPRWNIGYGRDGWDRLVNRLVLLGVPNEGTIAAYVAPRRPIVDIFGWGRTRMVSAMLPTFPYWRPAPGQAWTWPPQGHNPVLDQLNARPIPESVRVYALYGDDTADKRGGGRTPSGLVGPLENFSFSYGAGDGIVLVASTLGLPVNGGAGVPEFTSRLVAQINLGRVSHIGMLRAATRRIVDILQDRFDDSL